ncbi:hypothetical protein [Thermogemmatispora sp.]|uniref:hypothetical protein n=1 Tax=Thermogemmatispora sp. TaxID=1968838 RepID=UPI001D395A14|nr:hypothetical protein [Thermogemmatispora sp.]MBX5448783.1 hypothetical protein [Thermogemmatispora sp.]
MIRLFYWLYRFVSAKDKPLLQLVVGMLLIPLGAVVAYAACSGEYIYPYWVILGGGLAFFGLALVLKGLIILLSRRSASPATARLGPQQTQVAGAGPGPGLTGQWPGGSPFPPGQGLYPGASSASASSPPFAGLPPSQLSWWGGTPWPAGSGGSYAGYQPGSPQAPQPYPPFPGQPPYQSQGAQPRWQAPYNPQEGDSSARR